LAANGVLVSCDLRLSLACEELPDAFRASSDVPAGSDRIPNLIYVYALHSAELVKHNVAVSAILWFKSQ
jgi:hypothetical protein